jgi:carboxyl-terminal processing protease
MKPFLRSLLVTLVVLSSTANISAEDITEDARLPLEELRHFTQVFDQVRQAYVEDVDDKALLEMSIIGLLSSLDPHSAYLDKDAYGDLQEHTSGEFGGLGIEVSMEGGFIKVISPIDGTPAKRAGIQSGDLIIKLGDQLVQGMSLNEAIDIMRGPKGSTLTLTVARENVDGPLEIDIVRDIITVHSVRSKFLEPGFGYVRIAQFQEHTGREFREALNDLLKKDSDLKGMVLDLRNNPGGLLHASIDVTDAVLDGGLVVYTEGRLPSSNNSFHATPGDVLKGLPIVVLINEGSASAAEIVAGAMQDHSRALLLGTDSFGKGSVQTVIPLGDGRGIKLTTARYFTPNKRSIQAEGIKPDIFVEPAEIKLLKSHKQIKEANLSGHLSNNTDSKVHAENSATLEDNQLYEALNLLKGFDILSKQNRKP